MPSPLQKSLTVVFVLGISVSFSSLSFLVLFYYFSLLPPIPVITLILVCAAFQLISFLGGVVFEKRLWPSIICILVCSVGTAWVGAAGPGTLFGMPGLIIGSSDNILSNPLYLASLPVTIVGFAAGIGYFILGVIGLLYDSERIRMDRAQPKTEPALGKDAIYTQVADLLGVTGELPADDVSTGTPGGTADRSEEVPIDDKAFESEKDAETTNVEIFSPENHDDPVGNDAASDETDEAGEDPCETIEKEENGDEGLVGKEGVSALDEETVPASKKDETDDSIAETDSPVAVTTAAPLAPLNNPAMSHDLSAISFFSRMASKITSFFAVEQPNDTSGPVTSLPFAEEEAAPLADEPEAEEQPETEEEPEAEEQPDFEDRSESEEPLEPESETDEENSSLFLTLQRSELLDVWTDTPCTPVAAEDLSVTLETDRLRILRLDQHAFSALLGGIEQMEEAAGLIPSGEQLDPHTLDTFDALYARAMENSDSYKWFTVWIIASKEENKLLGSAGFKGAPGEDGGVELSCGVNEAWHGNGYASEAAVALCRWALLQKDVRVVTAETNLANMDSEDLLKQAGMKRIKETSSSCFWQMEQEETNHGA